MKYFEIKQSRLSVQIFIKLHIVIREVSQQSADSRLISVQDMVSSVAEVAYVSVEAQMNIIMILNSMLFAINFIYSCKSRFWNKLYDKIIFSTIQRI